MLGKGKRVILTFDDGPQPINALNDILSTLRQNQIIATFYVLGKEVQRAPSAAKQIVAQGHVIQNHSWDHPDLARASKTKVEDQLTRTQNIIKKTTGKTPTRVRPPYGNGGWRSKPDPELHQVAKKLSLQVKNWDIDTRDWEAPAGIKFDKVEAQLKKKKHLSLYNVLMHVNPATAKDLPRFIAYLKHEHFSFAKATY